MYQKTIFIALLATALGILTSCDNAAVYQQARQEEERQFQMRQLDRSNNCVERVIIR